MKLYRNLCAGVAEALLEIFHYHRHAPQVVEIFLNQNKKWGARDRNFVAGSVYECVRFYRRYCFMAGIEKIEQLQDAWLLIAAHLFHQQIPLPEWEEFHSVSIQEMTGRLQEAQNNTAILESVPDWLYQLGESELGNSWNRQLHALNEPAKLCLRINTLRSNRREVETFLLAQEVPFSSSPLAPDSLVVETRKNIRSWEIYQNGSIEIQDVGSQLIVPLLHAEKDQVIIDACAGAGGKSLQLAAAIQNEGRILAFDIHSNKLDELDRRARRAGASCITAHLSKPELIEKWKGQAHRLLIDAPCSGLGTIKRHPDLKWKLTPDFIQTIKSTQRQVLEMYAPLLRNKGILVYATCSILPSENEQQVAWFLEQHPDFSKIDELILRPDETGFDGFYACALQLNQ
ncbi:MAG: RsmB/NOP family class I SAM-dependent RNA methyltransferase [Chitinophagales bacterium]